MSSLAVRFGEQTLQADSGKRIRIGRALDSDICLSFDDRTISRLAATLEMDESGWMLVNRSASHSLAYVRSRGQEVALAPGEAVPLSPGVGLLIFRGATQYEVTVELGLHAPPRKTVSAPADTITPASVPLTPFMRRVLAALVSPINEYPGHYDPRPLENAAIAALLGKSLHSIERAIEEILRRVEAAGFGGVRGTPRARDRLARFALDNQLVSREDVNRLRIERKEPPDR